MAYIAGLSRPNVFMPSPRYRLASTPFGGPTRRSDHRPGCRLFRFGRFVSLSGIGRSGSLFRVLCLRIVLTLPGADRHLKSFLFRGFARIESGSRRFASVVEGKGGVRRFR